MKQLFEPLQIRNTTIRNRICVPAMVRHIFGMQETTLVTDAHIAHYADLARGGAGLVIVEATSISPESRATMTQVGLWDDAQIAQHAALAAAVHAKGATAVVQIQHAGWSVGAPPCVCVSDYTIDGVFARALTFDELQKIEQDFIAAVLRAAKAGYRGVELHGAHAFLISELLNKTINTRTDAYGINPLCFVQHIIDAVRGQVGDDFIIGIRLGGFEPTVQDAIAHAKTLEEMGIDYLNVSFGVRQVQVLDLPADYPLSAPFYAAEQIKKAVNIPVFAVNGIQTSAAAQQALEQTNIDMVCIGKGHLVNQNWANDAKAGRDVGRCFGCAKCAWRVPGVCPGAVMLKKQQTI